jgi:hypothetical protein
MPLREVLVADLECWQDGNAATVPMNVSVWDAFCEPVAPAAPYCTRTVVLSVAPSAQCTDEPFATAMPTTDIWFCAVLNGNVRTIGATFSQLGCKHALVALAASPP